MIFKTLAFRNQLILIVSLIMGITLLTLLLFGSPYVGIADNGDFARIMTSGGISVLDDSYTYEHKYFGYAHQIYSYGAFGVQYASSQTLFVLAAGLIARLWNSNTFDMHILGIVYSVCLLMLLMLVVAAAGAHKWWLQITIAACMLWVFFDIGYVAYFHSFYGEPVSMLALLLAVVSVIKLGQQEYTSNSMLVVLFCSAGILMASKVQNAPVGFVFATYGAALYYKGRGRVWKRIIVTGSILMIVVSILMYSFAPKELKQINLYQSIFYGILKDSPHPKEDLLALGVPPRYEVLAGTNYFQKDTLIKQDAPELTRDVYSKLGHVDIIRYYLFHPSRIVDKLHAAAKQAAFIRPYYLGNYEQSAGLPRGAMSFTYSSWSEGKKQLFPHTLSFYLISYCLFGLLILYEWRRKRIKVYVLELMLLIGIIGVIAVAVPLIGDGEADLGKHLFLFNVVFDCMVISFAVWVIFVVREAIHAVVRIKKQGQLFSRK